MSTRFVTGISSVIIIIFGVIPWISIQINQNLGLPIIYSIFSQIAGSISIIFGIAIIIVSTQEIFLKPKQVMVSPTDTPPKLITSGVLQYTRNPMYLGYFSIVLSEFFLFGHVFLLVYLVVLVLFVHFMVVYVEEKGLEKTFGSDYVEYKKRVPRWIPRFKNSYRVQ